MKCIKCFQVCGKGRLRVWLLTTCIPWQAKDALCISLPPGHRISHHRSVIVCVKCGSYSVWVNQKLRRDCRGNPIDIGHQSLREWRTANHHGQAKSGLSLSTVRRVPGLLWREFVRTWATLCHARSHMALWEVDLG